jgi:hypothetical protein
LSGRRRLIRRIAALSIAIGLPVGMIAAIVWVRQIPLPPSGVQTFEGLSREHVSGPVSYPQTPPVGGDHAPQWQNCGFYSSRIPNENGVHSIEHGAIWITYRPDLQPSQVNRIRQLAVGQNHVLASPYPDLPAPVVVSAWGRQLSLETAEDTRLDQFIAAFKQAPSAPERASCAGGVGKPN